MQKSNHMQSRLHVKLILCRRIGRVYQSRIDRTVG